MEKPAQKSHLSHAEEHEPNLDARVWISQIERIMDELPEGEREPKYLHLAALYNVPNLVDPIEKEAAEEIRAVSLPPSRSKKNRLPGDMPAGEAWAGPHKGTGFDPKPNQEEWKVRQNRLCARFIGCWCRRSLTSSG